MNKILSNNPIIELCPLFSHIFKIKGEKKELVAKIFYFRNKNFLVVVLKSKLAQEDIREAVLKRPNLF